MRVGLRRELNEEEGLSRRGAKPGIRIKAQKSPAPGWAFSTIKKNKVAVRFSRAASDALGERFLSGLDNRCCDLVRISVRRRTTVF